MTIKVFVYAYIKSIPINVIIIGEPSTFKNYIQLLIAAQRLAKASEKSEEEEGTPMKVRMLRIDHVSISI